jgi:ubiquinone/menaquinone biosynthesis C-methylase UbiE
VTGLLSHRQTVIYNCQLMANSFPLCEVAVQTLADGNRSRAMAIVETLLIRLSMKLTEISPQFKRFLWRCWYEHLAGYQLTDWRFMNYGFSPLATDDPLLSLQPADEPNRFAIQLYHHVASAVALEGLDVLEVGCGRGGGACFVKRYFRPRQMTGVDFSAQAIGFCERNQRLEGPSFVRGDAESLPLADASFDAVLNIESSHCYGSMPAFLSEVKRVLRPGGHFLFADLRSTKDCERLHENILHTGMTLLSQQDLTANVVEALRRDSSRKLALIERNINKRLLGAFRQFAAIEGSDIYRAFQDGTAVYVQYLLQK